MSKLVKQHIKELERIRPAQDRANFLRLDMNENPEGLPQEFFSRVIQKITPEMLAMYPEPGKLTQVIADRLAIKNDNILITNGSDEAIKSIFEVFSKEGSKFVSVHPTFEMYMVYAKMFNMKIETVNYESGFTVDANEIVQAIDEETSIVALLNPNNPIGTVYKEEEVKRVIEKAKEVDAIVIIDEAYHYFHNKTFIDLIKTYDNVIVTRTFSKLCSIAGLRIGYAVGSARIIGYLEKIRQTFNVNTVSLLFAQEILEEDGLIEKLVDIELEGRKYIINKLEESGRDIYAQNGNYVFIKCKTDKQKVIEKLLEKKILVRGYSVPILNDYIRISTGSKQAMKKFWQAFESIDKEV
jgi:histidinol-phosphate aminotransferase